MALLVILIGSFVELMPTLTISSNIPTIASVKPYTPLELQGRDLYIREGCSNCHSQTVRPFRSETERYGEYSKAGEFVYDHPFLWGSKRTGPGRRTCQPPVLGGLRRFGTGGGGISRKGGNMATPGITIT